MPSFLSSLWAARPGALAHPVASAPALVRSRTRLILWALAALLWFAPLATPHLLDPDEGRYAEIPREMLATGNWVTPRLDGIKYFEKPALQYWATAVAYELFGQNAWSVRLWPALTGFAGVLLTFWLARRVWDERTALLAALMQGGGLLYVAMARIATLDMGVTFMLQLALTAMVLLVHEPERAPRWTPALLGLGVTLALLSKGLIGLLIPGTVAVLYMLVRRDWTLPLRARLQWSVLGLVVLAAPWFVLVSLRNPQFAHFFFIYEHFDRFLSRTGFNRYEPDWFFIPVLAVGFLPWSTLLPRTLREAFSGARAGERATTMLLIWALFVFVFFSISQSKLIPYIVPMLPALAPLTARSLTRLAPQRFAWHLRIVAVTSAVLTGVILILWRLPLAARLVAKASDPGVLAIAIAFGLMCLGSALGALLAARSRVLGAAAVVAVSTVLFAQAGLMGAGWMPRQYSETVLVQRLRPLLTARTQLYCVDVYLQPLPFYLRRTCTLVGYRGELDFGLRREPWRWIANTRGFARAWQAQSDAAAIIAPAAMPQLRKLGVPMHVIYTAPSFIAVVKR